MFLTCCSPMSSNEKSSLSRTWSRTTRVMQIPPGSASASKRAATFTPSPKMSPRSHDDVAEIDADAKHDTPINCFIGVPRRHLSLHLHRAAHPIDDAAKFREKAIATPFHDPPLLLTYLAP